MPVESDFTIVFLGPEYYQESGQERIRYRYSATIPISIRPVRTLVWPQRLRVNQPTNSNGIAFVKRNGKKPYETFYGGTANRTAIFWFSLPADTIPPSWVQLIIASPPAKTEMRSNAAETTL